MLTGLFSFVGHYTIIFCYWIWSLLGLTVFGMIHMDHYFSTNLVLVLLFLFAFGTLSKVTYFRVNPYPLLLNGSFFPASVKSTAIGKFVFFFFSTFTLFFLADIFIQAEGGTFVFYLEMQNFSHYIFEARHDSRPLVNFFSLIWEPAYPVCWAHWVGDLPGSWEIYETIDHYFTFNVYGLLLSFLTAFLYTILLYYFILPPTRTGLFYFFYVISLCSLFICFLTDNFFVFYLAFEFILVPFFVIVGTWGSRIQRLGASLRLVFFTILFSLPLVTLIFINLVNDSFSFFFDFLNASLFPLGQHFTALFYLSTFFAFAVKIPLFPAHVWLPEAHGEAPTFGSVLLAGILLKLGGFGFMQIGFPAFYDFQYDSVTSIFPIVYTISVLTILYSNFSVFVQSDIKKTIAYYSIGHMGFVTLGLVSGSPEGFTGAMTIMIAHGLSAAGLFFSVGYLYEQSHTRSLFFYRGLATIAPIFSFFFFLFICANMGLPGTINFAGEQMVMLSLIKINPWSIALPLFGVLINGISSILFINRLLFGEVNANTINSIRDLRSIDVLVFALIGLPLVIFGFFPIFFTSLINFLLKFKKNDDSNFHG